MEQNEFHLKIYLNDIYEYVCGGKRPLIEGEKLFNAGHVIRIGVTKQTERGLDVIGYVLQSSNMKAAPHTINAIIKESKPTSWCCKCSCKAGLGEKCKHILAILFHINR